MWIGELVPLSPFIMVIAIIGFITFRKRAQDKHRAEMQKDLLTKFSSGQELNEFLKTEGGKLLLPEPTKPRTSAHQAGAGMLVLIIGGGLMIASLVPGDADASHGLRIAGLIVIAAGVGLMISAFVTQRLEQKWQGQSRQLQ